MSDSPRASLIANSDAASLKVKLGMVELLQDSNAFKAAFARFADDPLDGWSEDKHKYRGKEGKVIQVYRQDATVTIEFHTDTSDDSPHPAEKLNFPFEAVAKQLTVETPRPVERGFVELVQDETAFKNSFSRFEGDDLSGWSEEKHALRGKLGRVAVVYDDYTVTVVFEGKGRSLDFPFEAVAKQISVDRYVDDIQLGVVELITNETAFKAAFARFQDQLNGWSEKKHGFRGRQGIVVRTYGNNTVTICFDTGDSFDVPYEAIAHQVLLLTEHETKRISGYQGAIVKAWMAQFLKDLEDQTGFDCFDNMAFHPTVPALSRCCLCLFLMTLIPFAMTVYVIYLTLDGPTGTMNPEKLCQPSQGWEEWPTKLMNKLTGAALLRYMYFFLTSKSALADSKSIYSMLRDGKVLSIIGEPVYSAIGLIANKMALALAGVASVVVVYYTDNPLEIVLNSLALFFLCDLDDALVETNDYQRCAGTMRLAIKKVENEDSTEDAIVPYSSFSCSLKLAGVLLSLSEGLVSLSPLYIAICK